jgi:O-antigen/teichoic acid export membrane protein
VASVANVRLDQLLMAGLVASGELGLYAVAVSVASLTSGLSSAVSQALYSRVAEGEGPLAARSCRLTVGLVAGAAVVLGLPAPSLVPFVFGSDFAGAVPMVLVLLAAGIPLAGTTVLAAALNAGNDPAATMRAELAGLALTVPALVVLLPAGGGLAAAYISLAAYSVRLAMLLRSARRSFGGRWRDYVVPTRADLGWITEQARWWRVRSSGT